MFRRSKGKPAGPEAHGSEAAPAAHPAPEKTPPSRAVPPPRTAESRPPTLAQLLLSQGAVSREALEAARAKQRETGRFLGEILIEDGALEERSLISFLAKHCKVPHLSLLDYLIDQDIAALVPKEVCLKYRLLPIDQMGRNLTVAMVNPLDQEALEAVRAHCPELRIKPILCTHGHFETVSARMLGGNKREGPAELSATSLGLTAAPKRPKAPPPAPAGEGESQKLPDAETVAGPEADVVSRVFAPEPDEPAADEQGDDSGLSEVAHAMADSMRETYEVLARRVGLFHGLSAEQVARLFTEGVTVECAPDEVIFKKGEAGDRLYAILSGTVEIHDGGQRLAVLTQGDMFGEMALLSAAPRSATARALAPASLLALTRDLIHAAMPREVAVQLLTNIVVALSERLRRINETWKPPAL